MKKTLLALSSFLVGVSMSFGQLTDLGNPMGWSSKLQPNSSIPEVRMPAFDLQLALFEDSINNLNKDVPFRFGYEYSTNIDMIADGSWETLPNGNRICRILLKSSGAVSINIQFHDFFLPDGSRLDCYTPDHSFHHGAYTPMNNNPARMLGTDLVPGDQMIVEYMEPANVAGQGRLMIGMVVHGYKDIYNFSGARVNESGACNMDVICPDGAPWTDEKRSVARILNGGGLCTGSLVNNTAQDGTPYFLTANHCSPQTMGAAVFRFNYDSPICGSQTVANSQSGPTNQQVNGSTLRARKADSDFGLVELNSVPPASYNVYYAGWDNSGAIPQLGIGIHHPSGDVKKLAFDDDPLQSAQGLSSVANSEWQIEAWERNTTTEGGSSGSGLWDQNHRIVGQLHGGQATCANSINDYYGKFSMSWTGNGATTSGQRLRDWLDPGNSGAVTLDGWDPNAPVTADDAGITSVSDPNGSICAANFSPVVNLRNYGTNTLTSVTINYNVDGGANQTFAWTGSLTTGQSTAVTLPSMSSTNGAHTFNAFTSNPNGNADQNAGNDNASGNFYLISGPTASVTLAITLDNYGTETTWEILDGSTVLYSGGPYADGVNGTVETENIGCLADGGCYTLVVYDSYGDGMCCTYGNGSYTLTEDNTGGTLATGGTFTNSQTTNFCLTATTLTASFTASSTTVCAGSTVNFTDQSTGNPTGWTWNFPGATTTTSSQENPSVTYNTPGTYNVTLTVTDGSNNDTHTENAYIIVTSNPTTNATATSATCNGNCNGSAVATTTSGTAPYTYAWSNSATTATVNNLCAGSYTYTVTDANGCTATGSATVTEPTALQTAASANNASCGATDGSVVATATGGTSPYQYSLNGGASQGSGSFNNLGAGSYTVTITDANGCSATETVSVINPNAPSVATTSVNVDCATACNGTATATATGGTAPYTFNWNNGQTTATATGLCAGSYSVTVTDAAGCVSNSSATITEPVALASFESHVDETNGNDGSIDLSVTGGTPPYSYSWNNGATTEDLTGLTAGTYTVTVTDANGCNSTISVTILSFVSIDEVEQESFMLYPNPNDGNFILYFNKTDVKEYNISIYSSTGQVVYNQTVYGQRAVRLTPGLAVGVYFLEVANENGKEVKKLIFR